MSQWMGSVRRMEPDELVADLDDAQRVAVTSNATPLCILAGAGSGKTRVLTHRIAYRAASGTLDPSHTLAITFTRKAAGELVERLSALGLPRTLTAGTFHSVAFAQLRTLWADQGVRAPTVLDKPASFIMRMLPRTADFTEGLEISSEIDWARARMIVPEDYPAQAATFRRNPVAGIATVAEIFERYEEDKRTRGLIDMADLLDRYRSALATDKAFRAAQQWRFRHVFVDEFQDVNPAQNALLESLIGDRRDLCIVGDPNQAIYSFNGAEQSLLINFASRLGPSGTVSLDRNYRSTPQILAVGHSVLGRSTSGTVRPTLDDGEIPTITSHPDDRSEARSIARALRDRHHRGAPWKHQAVLVRTNAQATVIAEALTAADIPFRVRGLDDRESHASDAVEISTFHAAKGLEWHVVHLAGLEKGLVPITHARTPSAEAEEKRLLYVAITRAQRELHINWAQERSFNSKTSQRSPSIYLEKIEATRSALERGEDPFASEARATGTGITAASRPRSTRQRRARISGPDLDPAARELFDALRTWRSVRAKAASVPAYVIFHDSTLAAVATAAPRSLTELEVLPGLGPVKIARYGDDILEVVTQHV